ncbi:hypothetical protein JY651_29320 [Pyxidicoccus parkwayensis]|uniref:Uncharacterized protein n=1 Tax=Pyxidicoccus parkwayensis TaxID=2813578 RepID=A0ABX7NPG9_9BACT|nr:hypothetical protein [Pyxidicoccus parkwaysis]QSQ19417.1 hypothetical protein JY651_29320 [Pyxidicoccus parkwaysis]
MKLPGKFWGGWSVLALMALGGTATAQESAATPPLGGNGIKVGSGRLHPYFDLETRLDSGVGYFAPTSGQEPSPSGLSPDLSGEFAMHFRPGFKLEVPSSQLAFNLNANLDYVLYTGLMTADSGRASHLEGAADLMARLNPDAPLSLEVSDQFVRSDRTRTAAIGAGVLSLFNEARVRVPWRPGGGAVEVTPNVAYAVEFFQPLGATSPVGCTEGVCDPLTADRFDYGNLHFGMEGRWRFLPKTAVILDTGVDLRSYFNDGSENATLARALLGVAGLVSPKVAVTAKAGWGQNLAAAGGGTFLGQLEGTYLFSPTLSFKAGFLRTLEPVAAYGLFTDNRAYGEARALFGGKLTLHAGGGVDFISFTGDRSDTVGSLDVGPEYQFRPWLSFAAGYMLSTRSSSVTGGGINFTRHEGYARFSLTY